MIESYQIRIANEHDIDFIVSSWVKSTKRFATHYISADVYHANQAQHVKYLLAHSDTLVLCSSEDPAVIYAYIVYQCNVCHYVYTKFSLRKFGLASILWLAAGKPTLFTALTCAAAGYLKTNSKKLRFDPYFLYEKDSKNEDNARQI